MGESGLFLFCESALPEIGLGSLTHRRKRVRDRKQRRFVVGTLLAWAPFALLSCWANGTSRTVSNLLARTDRWLLVCGIVLGMIAEATAIPLLLGAFARRKWARGAFSVISLCCAVFMIFGFFVLLILVWIGSSQFQPRG